MSMQTIAQWLCLLTAAAAIPLVLNKAPGTMLHRLGCGIGLLGQPFWLLETMRSDQFGMFLVSLWFTGCYAFGLFRPERDDEGPVYIDVYGALRGRWPDPPTRRGHIAPRPNTPVPGTNSAPAYPKPKAPGAPPARAAH